MNKQTQAYINLALAMFFSATTFVIGKVLIGVMPVFLLLTIKFLVGSVFFSVSFFFKKKEPHIRSALKKIDIILLLLQAFFGAFLFNLFMLLGLRYINANYAAIVTCIAPGLIALFSYLILKEEITTAKLAAIMISIIGLLLVSWHAVVFNFHPFVLLGMLVTTHSVAGNAHIWAKNSENLLSKCSCITHTLRFLKNIFAVFIANSERSGKYKAKGGEQIRMLLVLCAMICGSLFPIFVKLVANKVSQSTISLLFNVLYLSLWNKGLKFVPANTASLFIGVVPISVAIMAYFLLHEVLTILQVLGMLLILLALIFGVERKQKYTNQHTVLTN